MSRLIKATSWTSISTIVNLSLTMLQLAILVRILAPSVFGQFAIVNLILEIFVAFALGGISNFLIYKSDVDEKTSNAIYFLALAIGAIFSGLLYILAPFIATQFGYDAIVQELRLATILLVISSLSSQYQAVGMKHFEHQTIAQIDIAAKIGSFIFAITNAELELLCLVGAVVVYQVLRLIGFIIFLGKHVKLSHHVDTSVYKEAFSYGIFDFGSQSLNIVRKQLDVMILAITLPAAQMGVYHVVKQLASRPAQALQPVVGKVALPAFAEVKQVKQTLQRVYQDFYILQLFILALIYVPIIIFSDLVLVLVFGESYEEYSWVLSCLAAFWFVRVASSNLVGPLVQATGMTKRNFMWNIALLIPNTIVIYTSSQFGVLSLVASMAVFQLILFPFVSYYFIAHIAKVPFIYSAKNMAWIVVLFALPLIIFKYFAIPMIPEIFLVQEAAVACLTGIVASAVFLYTKGPKQSLIRVKGF